MPRSCCFSALGYRFALFSADEGAIAFAERAYQDLAVDDDADHLFVLEPVATKDRFRLSLGDRVVIGAATVPDALDWMQWTVNRDAVVHARRGGSVVLHAACAEVDGRGIVIAGASGAGKSTLVAALTMQGLDYVTDEACAIKLGQTTITPYPRPLALGLQSFELLGLPSDRAWAPSRRSTKSLVPGSELPNAKLGGPCSARVIVFPDPDAPRGVRPISRAQALCRLGDSTFDRWAGGSAELETLADVTRGANSFTLSGGALGDIVEMLRRRLDNVDHAT